MTSDDDYTGATSSSDLTLSTSWEFTSDSTTPASCGGQQRDSKTKSRTLAPNLTRRSHKKSRGGCFSCKSRKIKCNETKPSCGSCQTKNLTCVYPTEPATRRSNTLPLIKRSLDTLPSFPAATFSMLDMRFFHHFLTIACPHLPVGNDHVWIHDIPQFAEQHEYLMHALLSLGASHLSRLTGVDYRRESLIHRGQAIAGLNHALSRIARTYGESDAMLASCYALTFQASYMGDGMADFITMIRGCALTTAKIMEEQAPTAFNLEPDLHFKHMASRLQDLPPVDPRLLEDAQESLENIQPLLAGETEQDFHTALLDVVTSLQESSASGYLNFVNVYGVWYDLCHESFSSFLDSDNLVAQLLLAYFVGIQLLMVPLAAHEWPQRADRSRVRVLHGYVDWAHGIFDKLEGTEWAEHLGWPRMIIASVVAEIDGEVLLLPSVLQLHLHMQLEGQNITPGMIMLDET